MSEVQTVEKFIEFVKELDALCNKYNVTYNLLQETAEILDDFGWEHHPAMILHTLSEKAKKEEA